MSACIVGPLRQDARLRLRLSSRDRILIEVDAFSPGSAVHPYAANLLENIQKRNLRVDTIVPLHGAVAPFAELVKVAGVKTN